MQLFASLHQYGDFALLGLRIGLGAVFLVHGLSKKAMWKMQPNDQLKKPMLNILRLLSVCEPLGGLAMLAGFLTQLAGIGLGIIMLGAMYMKMTAFKKPFTGANGEVGWEFDFVLFFMAYALVVFGAGGLSVDHFFFGL